MNKAQELQKKYIDRAESLLADALTDEKHINGIIDIIADAIDESIKTGADSVRLPFQIAELEDETIIEDIQTENSEHHYFWKMKAGFTDRAEAKAYINKCRENAPGKEYGFFVNGTPENHPHSYTDIL